MKGAQEGKKDERKEKLKRGKERRGGTMSACEMRKQGVCDHSAV